MLISLQKRFVFIANLKTASTAIEAALRPEADIALVEPGVAKHQSFASIELRFSWLFSMVDVKDFLMFGIIRDPVDFVISLYNSHNDPKFKDSLELYAGTKSFSEFFDEWNARSTWQLSPQHERFLDSYGKVGANYIISYNNLARGLRYVSFRLGVPALLTLPQENVSPNAINRDSLTAQQIQQIKERYSADYDFIDFLCDRPLSSAEREAWPTRVQEDPALLDVETASSTNGGTAPEDVIWAYRLLLEREPESEAAIEQHLSARTRRELRDGFLASEEFQTRNRLWPKLDYMALTGNPPPPAVAPTGIKQGSRICRQADLSTDAYRYWMRQMQLEPRMSRQLWEWFFITDALFQRDQLTKGGRGIGLGVGREPLTALFASLGCNILATDLPTEQAAGRGWLHSGQHADDLDALAKAEICEMDAFTARVQFQAVDMNDIPECLNGLHDFCWSVSAIQHLGSLEHGVRFVERAMALLKPDGIAVHTTEYNLELRTPMPWKRLMCASIGARISRP